MNRTRQVRVSWKDTVFSSIKEARWAVFLDGLGAGWTYRQKRAALPSGIFVPSFWLPGWQVWLDVRAASPGDAEKALARELCMKTGFDVLLPDGLPSARWQGTAFRRFSPLGWNGSSSQPYLAAAEDRFRLCLHPHGTGGPLLLGERLRNVLGGRANGADEAAVREALVADMDCPDEAGQMTEAAAARARTATFLPAIDRPKRSSIAFATVADLYKAMTGAEPVSASFPWNEGWVYKRTGRCMQCGGLDTLQLEVRWQPPEGRIQNWVGPVNWSCRACNAKGGLVDYCMKQHGYSREEAMRLLVGSWPADTPTLLDFARTAYPKMFSNADGEAFSLEPPEGYTADIQCAYCLGRQFVFRTNGEGRCRAQCLACGNHYGAVPQAKNAGQNRSGDRDRDWARAVRKRWAGKCAVCGSTEHLEAHHIIPWQVNESLRLCLNNGILLCRKHHIEAHAAFAKTPAPDGAEQKPDSGRTA